jgi:hypothetical protein
LCSQSTRGFERAFEHAHIRTCRNHQHKHWNATRSDALWQAGNCSDGLRFLWTAAVPSRSKWHQEASPPRGAVEGPP